MFDVRQCWISSKHSVVCGSVLAMWLIFVTVCCWLPDAWKAVVDGVQDARARAHMKQLSFTGVYSIISVDSVSFSTTIEHVNV